jgi:hypothetical protein
MKMKCNKFDENKCNQFICAHCDVHEWSTSCKLGACSVNPYIESFCVEVGRFKEEIERILEI